MIVYFILALNLIKPENGHIDFLGFVYIFQT